MAAHDEVDVEKLIEEAGLDDKVITGIRGLKLEQQMIVLKLVTQQERRNPSAFAWSKVKAMQANPFGVKLDYVKSKLDDRAAPQFEALPVHLQLSIAAELDVIDTKNISARIWSKIKAAPAGARAFSPVPIQMPPPMPAPLPMQMPVGNSFASLSRAGAGGHGGGSPKLSATKLGLDDDALKMLSQLSVEQQAAVIADVDPEKCRNPSAVVIRKITRLRQQSVTPLQGIPTRPVALSPMVPQVPVSSAARNRSRTPPPMMMSTMPMASVQIPMAQMPVSMPVSMIQGSGGLLRPDNLALDAKAQQAVRSLPPDHQLMVLGLLSKESCKNPSAVAWSKVKQMREDPTALKLEFVRKSVDGNAAAAVATLSEAQLASALGDVDVAKCRNLSAVVWSKVKPLVGTLSGTPTPASSLTLDSGAQEALSRLSQSDQDAVMQELERVAPQNPSAFVFAKVKKMQSGSA